MKIYQAESLDIAMAAVGPMGSPTIVNWQRFFKSIASAKKACENDYDHKPAIKWKKANGGRIDSGDLLHVQYVITPIKVES